MPKIVTIGVLLVLATVLCGFSDVAVESSVGVYRGEPVRNVIAKLGPPIQVAYAEGQRIYYWPANVFGDACKIWGAARNGIIVNWGYQSCAYW
jgi:hypothetical protein